MIFDRLFTVIFNNGTLWVAIDFLALVGSAYVLWPQLKEELREVKVIDRKLKMRYKKVPISPI
jgi:hypothetical protein